MRILFISNYYPPFELGGWEQLTQEIRDGLSARGHATAVLTSHHRADESLSESGVFRQLHPESQDLTHYRPSALLTKSFYEHRNQRILEQVIDGFQPDVVFVHAMWNLPRSVAWQAERSLPGRVVYYIASDWPYQPDAHEKYWRAGVRRPLLKPVKRLAARAALFTLGRQRRQLKFEHVLCVSQAVQQDLDHRAGIPCERSRVIYNGIDPDEFAPSAPWEPGDWKNSAPAFLYAGGLFQHKGAHTAIAGFARAAARPSLAGATLTILGSGHPDYEARLRHLAGQAGLNGRVVFRGRVERAEMPAVLRQYDVLLVPSQYEALSRMMQEAMASGLVVIGTSSWGSREILLEGETGLIFGPEDPDGLALKLEQVVLDDALRRRLALSGRQAVLDRFNIRRTVAEIESYLLQVCETG